MSCDRVSSCPAFPSGTRMLQIASNPCGTDFCGDDGNYGNNNPLPVELISFEGVYIEDKVKLSWSTETEINNDYFTLERSSDGLIFTEIAQIPGNGSKERQSDYNYIDRNPVQPTSYYRLVQTDFDGRFEIFPAIAVPVTPSSLKVYPTSVQLGGHIIINTPVFEYPGTRLKVSIFDTSGRLVIEKEVINGDEALVNLASIQSPGVYMVNVNGLYASRIQIN